MGKFKCPFFISENEFGPLPSVDIVNEVGQTLLVTLKYQTNKLCNRSIKVFQGGVTQITILSYCENLSYVAKAKVVGKGSLDKGTICGPITVNANTNVITAQTTGQTCSLVAAAP